MTRVYDSREHRPSGITRNIEVGMTLDGCNIKFHQAYFILDDAYTSIKEQKNINGILIEGWYRYGGKESGNYEAMFPIIKSNDFTRTYSTPLSAHTMFDEFIKALNKLRQSNPSLYGAPDVNFQKTNKEEPMLKYDVNHNRPLEVKIFVEGDKLIMETVCMSPQVYDSLYRMNTIDSFKYESYRQGTMADPVVTNKLCFFQQEPRRAFRSIQQEDKQAFLMEYVNALNKLRESNPTLFGAPDSSFHSTKPIAKTTKENNNMNTNITEIGQELLKDNKEFATFELERSTGLAAFDSLEKKIIQTYPGTEEFWKSKLGVFILSNGVHAAGKIYTGPQAPMVHEATKIVMRGAYARIGDSVNMNGFIESFFDSILSVIPGLGKTEAETKTTEPK